MDGSPDTLSAEAIAGALLESKSVNSASVLESNWIRASGQNQSLLICADVEQIRETGRLERGAELLESPDIGVLFVDPPQLCILSVGGEARGDVDFLGWDEEEIIATLLEIVPDLLQEGFDTYPDLSFQSLTRFFTMLLPTGDEDATDKVKPQLGQENHGFLPPLPPEMEADVANVIASWVLRDDPQYIADFGSGGDALTTAFADQRTEEAELYLVDLPNDTARVGRLMSAYRYPNAHSMDMQSIPHTFLLNDGKTQIKLDELSKENGDFDEGAPIEKFDAVFSGLIPDTMLEIGDEFRERLRDSGLIRPHTGLSTYLAVEGLENLADGGRGAFFLTLGQMARFDILKRALEIGRVHAVLLFGSPGNTLVEWPSQPVAVVLFEKSKVAATSEDVRVIEIGSTTLDPRINRLIQAPSAQVRSEDVNDVEGLEFRAIPSEDLEQLPIRPVLYEPQLAPFLRADETVHLEQLVDSVRQNRPTGANDFFYFEKTKAEQLGFPRRFLTPVIKRPPEDSSFNLGYEQTNYYALDLREYIDSLKSRGIEISERSVLESLQADGYSQVVDYIEEHQNLADRATLQRRNLWFCPFRKRDQVSEVLLFRRYSDGSWYRLQDKDILVDQSWYVFECDPEIVDSLHRLLNSEPYQNLLSYYGHSSEHLYQTAPLSELRKLPIATGPLKEGLNEFPFPPSRRREQRYLDEAVVERCRDSDASEALESLLDPDDRFAWAWFLSPNEYEEFKEMYYADEKRAEGYIADRLHEEEVKEMLAHITESDLHTGRWDIIEELAEEYQQENYRLFIYAATPQFEGFIMDWAEEKEYDIVWKNGRPYVEISNQDETGDQEPIPKGLGALIDAFIPRGFGDFLLDEVKDLRDATAHGEVIANSREQAAITFLSLHTLTLQISEGKLQE
jgi:hypothetical protein